MSWILVNKIIEKLKILKFIKKIFNKLINIKYIFILYIFKSYYYFRKLIAFIVLEYLLIAKLLEKYI